MSVRTMARVWTDSQHSGGQLLMLLAIADFADDDGNAYPAVPTLAKKCRTTPRHANRLIAALVARGELEVLVGRGPVVPGGRVNLFRVRLKTLKASAKEVTDRSPPYESEVVTPKAASGDVDVLEVVTYPSVKPSLNHQEPSERSASPKPSSRKPSRRKTQQTFAAWLAAVKADGDKAVPESDPIFEYCDKVGIPVEFLEIAWTVFKADHTTGKASTKLQADWRATFRNYVRKNYLKLWFFDSRSGQCTLTSAGLQAAREHGFRSSPVNDTFAGAI